MRASRADAAFDFEVAATAPHPSIGRFPSREACAWWSGPSIARAAGKLRAESVKRMPFRRILPSRSPALLNQGFSLRSAGFNSPAGTPITCQQPRQNFLPRKLFRPGTGLPRKAAPEFRMLNNLDYTRCQRLVVVQPNYNATLAMLNHRRNAAGARGYNR